MPRRPRILGDDLHYHAILRCNNKERLLILAEIEHFLSLLGDYQRKFGFQLYDYTCLQTHVHLLLSTHNGYYVDRVIQEICLAFAKEYNGRHGRVGHFWRDRYWSRVVTHDRYALCCLRYFAWNAPKAGLVQTPAEWPWCGYQFYSTGEHNSLLTPHPAYLALGRDGLTRQVHYRDLVMTPLCPAEEYIFQRGVRAESKRFRRILLGIRYPMVGTW